MGSINSAYNSKETLAAVKVALKQDSRLPSVALGEFLTADAFLATARACKTGWKHEMIADQYSYATHTPLAIQKELRAFVQTLTGKAPLPLPNRRFAHRDYTLLHDEVEETPGIIALLFLEDFDELWGGQVIFTKNGETLGVFTPAANTLLVVERKKGVHDFVQYVNHRAQKRVVTLISA